MIMLSFVSAGINKSAIKIPIGFEIFVEINDIIKVIGILKMKFILFCKIKKTVAIVNIPSIIRITLYIRIIIIPFFAKIIMLLILQLLQYILYHR